MSQRTGAHPPRQSRTLNEAEEADFYLELEPVFEEISDKITVGVHFDPVPAGV
ncbi:hypothetical protein Hanom_Chr14g01315051 [Helianthus anomalus]